MREREGNGFALAVTGAAVRCLCRQQVAGGVICRRSLVGLHAESDRGGVERAVALIGIVGVEVDPAAVRGPVGGTAPCASGIVVSQLYVVEYIARGRLRQSFALPASEYPDGVTVVPCAFKLAVGGDPCLW